MTDEDAAGFEVWLKELDIIATMNGVLGASYTQATGKECWVDMYEDGLTAYEAWQEELSAASHDVDWSEIN
jgi:hypothetical protein